MKNIFAYVKNVEPTSLKANYRLPCIVEPIKFDRIDESNNLEFGTFVAFDRELSDATTLNELFTFGSCQFFDNHDQFNDFKDKNGKVEYDENMQPIKPKKSIVDTIINLIGI